MVATAYIGHCPPTVKENLRWRLRMRRAALHDHRLRRALKQAAMDDVLFFFQAFLWVLEPRGRVKVLPFCMWKHQIPAILSLVKSIEDGAESADGEPVDVIFDKARAQGATWICLGVILWMWLREPMFSAGIISRNEEAVDKRNYPGSLFPKLDWAIEQLPFWLRPRGFNSKRDRSIADHVWHNCENGATIVGTACTPVAFSGDRLSVLFYDEAAKVDHNDFQDNLDSTQHVTLTRWIVSTHFGDSGPFFDMVADEHGRGIKVVLDWRDNPTQNRLLYRFEGNRPRAMRIEEQLEVERYVRDHRHELEILRRKGFVHDMQVRGPWYDSKCLQKGATPRGIAQDLDRNPRSTVGKLFNPDVLDRVAKRLVRPPVWEGDCLIRDGGIRLVKGEGGPLKLWFAPGLDDEPPHGLFVIGADIGTGLSGASNSSLVGGRVGSGEQVLEFAKAIPEARFAHLAVAIAEWLREAMLIWEAQGPTGKRFGNAVVKELQYWNVYRRPGKTASYRSTVEQVYGWVNNQERDKVDLFEDAWVAMDDEDFKPRSNEFILECRGWERDKNGKIVYHGTGHGDRAIAGGLCWKGIKEISSGSLDKTSPKEITATNRWSMAGRLQQRQEAERRQQDDDLAGFSCQRNWR